MEKKLYEVKEIVEKNGGPVPMSTAGIYKACAEGKIPTVRIGAKIFIPSWWLTKLLAEPEGGIKCAN